MGLGKTLQSICILASDHYLREKMYKVRICLNYFHLEIFNILNIILINPNIKFANLNIYHC